MRHGSKLALEICPYCGVARPNLSATGAGGLGNLIVTTQFDGSQERTWGTYVCSTCGGVVLAAAASRVSKIPVEQTAKVVAGLAKHTLSGIPRITEDISLLLPETRQIPNEVPDEAREPLREAMATLAAPRASLMVSCSAVDAMLKVKGYETGSLYNRIEAAAADHLITEGMAQWAHQVRLEANGQRHADRSHANPTTQDARLCLDFAMALAEFLFVLPARVSRGLRDSQNPPLGA